MPTLADPNVADRPSTGWQQYQQAKSLIPGGTQLLSKRPENFLPDHWPCYYQRAAGCELWDMDGRRLVDMTTTGIGACLLGYADPDVNAAAKASIDAGNLATLNSPIEVQLAKKLIEIHPWAGMARFARSGGESMMVAIRIARAFTGRSGVALCGYHGWGDWYLAANLAEDSSLDGHLLPGLQPHGVPTELRNTVQTFRYNKIEELEHIATTRGDRVAAIVMEPIRFADPTDGFLEKVRAIATHIGAVLIFDEITSGWRHNFGGSHLRLGVNPDIAVFAKSLSNGFPMAAVVGTTSVMQAAQSSFISSTFWTETIGPSAALATLDKMQRTNVSAHVERIGRQTQEGWRATAAKHGIDLTVSGWPALCTFSLNYPAVQAQELKTLLTQELLDRSFLGTNAFYPTLAHQPSTVDAYLEAMDESFAVLARAIAEGDVFRYLRSPVASSGFSRLT